MTFPLLFKQESFPLIYNSNDLIMESQCLGCKKFFFLSHIALHISECKIMAASSGEEYSSNSEDNYNLDIDKVLKTQIIEVSTSVNLNFDNIGNFRYGKFSNNHLFNYNSLHSVPIFEGYSEIHNKHSCFISHSEPKPLSILEMSDKNAIQTCKSVVNTINDSKFQNPASNQSSDNNKNGSFIIKCNIFPIIKNKLTTRSENKVSSKERFPLQYSRKRHSNTPKNNDKIYDHFNLIKSSKKLKTYNTLDRSRSYLRSHENHVIKSTFQKHKIHIISKKRCNYSMPYSPNKNNNSNNSNSTIFGRCEDIKRYSISNHRINSPETAKCINSPSSSSRSKSINHIKYSNDYIIECSKCRQPMQSNKLKRHEAFLCSERTVICAFCKCNVMLKFLSQHYYRCIMIDIENFPLMKNYYFSCNSRNQFRNNIIFLPKTDATNKSIFINRPTTLPCSLEYAHAEENKQENAIGQFIKSKPNARKSLKHNENQDCRNVINQNSEMIQTESNSSNKNFCYYNSGLHSLSSSSYQKIVPTETKIYPHHYNKNISKLPLFSTVLDYLTMSNRKSFKCVTCSFFSDADIVIEHYLNTHFTIQCQFCTEIVHTHSLMDHFTKCSERLPSSYLICPYCQANYIKGSKLIHHISNNHATQNCLGCNKTFSINSFAEHVRSCFFSDNHKCICPTCHAYLPIRNLGDHLLRHTSFSCPICNMNESKMLHFESHIKLCLFGKLYHKSVNTKIRKPCPLCGKSLSLKETNDHFLDNHKYCKCPFCHTSYNKKIFVNHANLCYQINSSN